MDMYDNGVDPIPTQLIEVVDVKNLNSTRIFACIVCGVHFSVHRGVVNKQNVLCERCLQLLRNLVKREEKGDYGW